MKKKNMKRAPSEYDFITLNPALPSQVLKQRIEKVLDSLGFEFLRQENDDSFVYQVRDKGTLKANYRHKVYEEPELGRVEADCLIYYDGLDSRILQQFRQKLEKEFSDEVFRAV